MRRLATVAILLVGYAGLGGALAAPAEAAQCSGMGGVSVVVDFDHGAGGGTSTACDGSGGGKYASAIFPESGYPLTYVSGSGGFVCRVDGRPADADCSRTAPANAYWGLFWAKAGATSWTYASSGVGSLRVPDGGAVAFAFQDGGGTDYPGVGPSQRSAPKPSPTPAPTATRTPSPTRSSAPKKAPTRAATQAPRTAAPQTTAPVGSGRGVDAAAHGATPTPSTSVSASPRATTAATPTDSPSVSATAGDSAGPEALSGSSTAVSSNAEGGGLPWWVPAGVVVLLAGAGAGAAWWRTRGPTA